jgi:hypothetical protein
MRDPKIERTLSLISDGKSNDEINEIIKKEFGKGFSNTSLKELRQSAKNPDIFEIEIQEVYPKAQYQTRRLSIKARTSKDRFGMDFLSLKLKMEEINELMKLNERLLNGYANLKSRLETGDISEPEQLVRAEEQLVKIKEKISKLAEVMEISE